MNRNLVIILFALLLLAAILACGTTANTACYSTYPGCDATAYAIETAIAAAATAAAR